MDWLAHAREIVRLVVNQLWRSAIPRDAHVQSVDIQFACVARFYADRLNSLGKTCGIAG
jgi:hypothetical protein